MKRKVCVLLLVALLLAFSRPVMAAEERLPPPPEWPIIGPILRWLGLGEKSAEIEASPIPTVPPGVAEYTPEGVEDLVALWEKMANGETVRVTLEESTAQAMLDFWVDPMPGISTPTVHFQSGAITLEATLATSQMKEYLGFDLPDFLVKDDITLRLAFSAQAVSCRPQIRLERVEINGKSWPVKGTVQDQLNQKIGELWPQAHLCIESIYITDGALIVEGYREQP